MLGRSIKYYRLKKNLTKKALAEVVGVTPMAISNYENDKRQPSMEIIKLLAQALDIRVTDFLDNSDMTLEFSHGKFRKGTKLRGMEQEYIYESVEEYYSRFFQTISFLGGKQILEKPPVLHQIELANDPEENACRLREYLNIPQEGPIPSLVDILENKGILVCFLDIESRYFSGLNGTVNEIPYIVVNSTMPTPRIRSTIVHELAHMFFNWPNSISLKEEEAAATAISGAFLFPKTDAIRELGAKRTAVSKAMTITCREYGISMYLLVIRSRICGIINESIERDFYIKANKANWRTNEPDWGGVNEDPKLFKQFVYRAVAENEISVQKGVELLKATYDSVINECFI